MKKLLNCLCVLLIAVLMLPNFAHAESDLWYRAETDTVAFFMQPIDTENQKLFLIEKSYYLRAIGVSNEFIKIQMYDNTDGFVQMTGYAKVNAVKLCKDPPTSPIYPKETLTVKQANAILKGTPSSLGENITVALNGQKVQYYGKSHNNADWYYIKYEDYFGYVQKGQLSLLNIPLHPTPIEVVKPPEEIVPPTTDDLPKGDSSVLEIVLILLICIPAVVIVLVLFLPRQTKKPKKFQPPRPKYMSDSDSFDDLDLL